jgi:hypothetical protein
VSGPDTPVRHDDDSDVDSIMVALGSPPPVSLQLDRLGRTGNAHDDAHDALMGPVGGKLRFARAAGAMAVAVARGVAVEDVSSPVGVDTE